MTFLHLHLFLVLVLIFTLVDLPVGRSHELKQISITSTPFFIGNHLLCLRHLQFVKNFGTLLVFPLIFSSQMGYIFINSYFGHRLVAGQLLFKDATLMVTPLTNIINLMFNI